MIFSPRPVSGLLGPYGERLDWSQSGNSQQGCAWMKIMKAGFIGPGHETMRHVSRRLWLGSGLATCGYLQRVAWPVVNRPKPRLLPATPGPDWPQCVPRARDANPRVFPIPQWRKDLRRYLLARVMKSFAGLTEFAEREKIGAGHFTGIGALSSATLGWFDAAHKAYRNIPISEQVELISLIGDLGFGSAALRKSILTARWASRRTGARRPFADAFVWPTLEVFFTALPQALVKKPDGETGLDFFDLSG